MRNDSIVLPTNQLDLALQRLELLLEPDAQEIIEKLRHQKDVHLPVLSQELRKSPGKLKKKLDDLKASGLVYSSKRYPKGYSLNQLKCLKIKLKVEAVVDLL